MPSSLVGTARLHRTLNQNKTVNQCKHNYNSVIYESFFNKNQQGGLHTFQASNCWFQKTSPLQKLLLTYHHQSVFKIFIPLGGSTNLCASLSPISSLFLQNINFDAREKRWENRAKAFEISLFFGE